MVVTIDDGDKIFISISWREEEENYETEECNTSQKVNPVQPETDVVLIKNNSCNFSYNINTAFKCYNWDEYNHKN